MRKTKKDNNMAIEDDTNEINEIFEISLDVILEQIAEYFKKAKESRKTNKANKGYTNEETTYLFGLLKIVNSVLMFKDGAYFELRFNNIGVEVIKKQLDFCINEIHSEYSEELHREYFYNNLMEILPIDDIKIKEKALNESPKNFIKWLIKTLDLKYNVFNEDLRILDLDSYIEQEIEVKKYPLERFSNCNISDNETSRLKSSDFIYYLTEIDYLLPNKGIKVRLSYSFCCESLISKIKEVIFGEKIKNKEELINILKSEIASKNNNSILDLFYKGTLVKNCLFDYLEGIQVVEIDEDFEHSLLDLIYKEEYKNIDYFEFTEKVDMVATTSGLYASLELADTNEDLFIKNLNDNEAERFVLINDSIIDIEDIFLEFSEDYEEQYGNCDYIDFNNAKDILYAHYKYLFSTIDEKLPYLMNKNAKELLIDFIEKIEKKF